MLGNGVFGGVCGVDVYSNSCLYVLDACGRTKGHRRVKAWQARLGEFWRGKARSGEVRLGEAGMEKEAK